MRLQDPKRISRLLEIPAEQQQHTPVAAGQFRFPIKCAGCTGRVAVIVNRGMLRSGQLADTLLVRLAWIVATRVQHCQAWKRSHVHGTLTPNGQMSGLCGGRLATYGRPGEAIVTT